MDMLASTILTGAGATLVMDTWAIARKRLLGAPAPNYGLLGRWLAYVPRGRFRHDSIAAAAPVVRTAVGRMTARPGRTANGSSHSALPALPAGSQSP